MNNKKIILISIILGVIGLIILIGDSMYKSSKIEEAKKEILNMQEIINEGLEPTEEEIFEEEYKNLLQNIKASDEIYNKKYEIFKQAEKELEISKKASEGFKWKQKCFEIRKILKLRGEDLIDCPYPINTSILETGGSQEINEQNYLYLQQFASYNLQDTLKKYGILPSETDFQ